VQLALAFHVVLIMVIVMIALLVVWVPLPPPPLFETVLVTSNHGRDMFCN